VISETKFFEIFFQGNSRLPYRGEQPGALSSGMLNARLLANPRNVSRAAKLHLVKLRTCERCTPQPEGQGDVKKKKPGAGPGF
jgi:hypothetical protein